MPVKRKSSGSGRIWVLLLLPGVVLGFLLYWLVYELRISSYQKQFEFQAEASLQTMVQNLAAADAALNALSGLNQASDVMDPALFTPFSEKILQKYPYIKSIQYLSYISTEEQKGFVEEMQEQGFSQFNIHVLSGTKAEQTKQTNFLITSFIEPLTPSSARIMGMDWIGSRLLLKEIETAALTNRMSFESVPLFLNSKGHYLLLKPTYFGRTISQNQQQRRQQFSGVFLLLIDWNRLVNLQQKRINELAINYDLEIKSDFKQEPSQQAGHSLTAHSFYRSKFIQMGSSHLTISANYKPALRTLDYFYIGISLIIFLILYVSGIYLGRNRYLSILENKHIQLQLFKERERAEVALNSIGDAVITINVDKTINYINPIAERILRKKLDDVCGKPVSEMVHLLDLSTGNYISDPVNYYLDKTQSYFVKSGIDIVLNVSGSLLSVDVNASPMLDVNGEFIGSVLVLRDVSLERKLTSELVYQASHDALTGLVNRLEFEKKLKEILEMSRQQNTLHALCYLDMDQFKLVNDTCGHIAGDELLKQVAGLLLVQMREDDLVARLGGDEFGILILSCDQVKAEEIAERVRQGLNDYRFSWEDKIFDVSASIGLVMINRMSGNLSDVLSAADLACYAAKDGGRNSVHTYRVDDEEIAHKYSQMEWLPRIKNALRKDAFALALQSVAPFESDCQPTMIYEFLLRWPQPDGSFISPGIIIPSAERYDLMRELDRWIIKQAMRCIPALERKFNDTQNRMYNINLSGQSVGDAGLVKYIENMIEKNAVNPAMICFEVTETVAIANFSNANDFISQLRAHGCRFALDDFGSGLSSFGYLKRLQLDFLKIDGLFVRDMLKDPVDLAMVRTIHDVARVLKLKTIAEWVEDEEVYLALKEIGVDYVQGFYLDKPKMISEILS